jgi:hypothetical protein
MIRHKFSLGFFLEFNENFGLGEIEVYIRNLPYHSGKWLGRDQKENIV